MNKLILLTLLSICFSCSDRSKVDSCSDTNRVTPTTHSMAQALLPLPGDSIAGLRVHKDTLECLLVGAPHKDYLPLVSIADTAACKKVFQSSVSFTDTAVYDEQYTKARNLHGSYLLFNKSHGVVYASLSDKNCRWEDGISVGMNKADAFRKNFLLQDTCAIRTINVLFISSGMNLNGTYITFRNARVSHILETRIPD